MQFVTFGLLFGLGTLLWCLAISVTQSLTGDTNVSQVEEPDHGAEPAYQR